MSETAVNSEPISSSPRSPPKLPPKLAAQRPGINDASATKEKLDPLPSSQAAVVASTKKSVAIVTAEGKPKPKYSQPVSTPRKVPDPGSPAAEALKKITEMRAKGFKLQASDSMSVGPKQINAEAASTSIQSKINNAKIDSTNQVNKTSQNSKLPVQSATGVSKNLKQIEQEIQNSLGSRHGVHFYIHAPIHMHIYNAPSRL